MITMNISSMVLRDDGHKYRIEGSCLSSDIKPTDVANGSVLIEMDTGDVYQFDEEGSRWLKFT